MIPITSWNVRGLGDKSHQKAVRELISENGLHVCALIETRVVESKANKIRDGLLTNWTWFFDYTYGPGRRIWVGWRPDYVNVEVIDMGEQFIHCKISSLASDLMIYTTFVHGLYSVAERRPLWDELRSYAELRANDLWLVMGDFNVILDASEGVGGAMDGELNDEFSACLSASDLVTIPTEGALFSWSNKQTDGVLKWRRLDRVVANPVWLARFSNVVAFCAPRKTSDHSPLIIRDTEKRNTKRPWFRFDNHIAENSDFKRLVEHCWKDDIYGVPLYKVISKLKRLKPLLKKLKVHVGSPTHNVQRASKFLEVVQTYMASFPMFLELNKLEKVCRGLFSKAVQVERVYLSQRAKVEWLKDGDQCTAFFFRRMAVRKAKMRINRLEGANGDVLHDPELVSNEMVLFYNNLLGTSTSPLIPRGSLDEFISHRITHEEACHMIRAVGDDEIREVLFSFDDNKAPGPDGFNSLFFKRTWSIVGKEVTTAISSFFATGKLVRELNSTILTLIPKVENPTKPKDFRPISCCNILYKVISKIMANRLCEVLNGLIAKSQTAFVPGRRINDNILLAQELLHAYNHKNQPERCAFKVDLMKAYDTVEWEFVLEVLRAMNIHPVFVEWIRECMTTPSFSININGVAEGNFKGKRGLRQGDPISPYLFVIVMEVLNGLIQQKVVMNPGFQFHWKCFKTKTVMLSFADDLLLFCNADVASIRILGDCVAEFGEISGLKANPDKSTMFISAKARPNQVALKEAMGFEIGTLPVRYLGVPLVTSKLTMDDCKPLLDKVDSRLGSWTNKTLSYAGRVQLIKSVLASLHVYWASMFILPKGVLRSIEAKMRNFLWGGSGGRGYSKVSWESVCLRIEDGGLGITPLLAQNQALMTKNIWFLLTNQGTSSWVEWVRIYRLRGVSFWSIPIPSSCPWSWRQMLKLRPLVMSAFEYRIGNGEKFLLWGDPWHKLGILGLRYPRGPSHTQVPLDALVAKVIRDGEWNWPGIYQFDIHQITRELPEIMPNRNDEILWRRHPSGKFTTQSALTLFFPHGPKVTWAALLHGPGKIPKHNFILWLAIRERLSLREKPWIGHGDSTCVLCDDGQIETHDHLFFNCNYSRRCVRYLTEKVKFSWPYSDWTRGVEWAARRWRGKHKVKSAYRILLAAIVYGIWRERNTRIFDQQSITHEEMTQRVLNLAQDRVRIMCMDDSIQSRAVRKLWHIAW